MNISIFYRITGLAFALLLVACGGDDDRSGSDKGVMTAEKYALIGMALDRLAYMEIVPVPAGSRIVIADQTTMSHMLEFDLEGDETMNALTALDSRFPHDFLAWTPEESDRAFARYYQANLEPVDIRLEDLGEMRREVALLMHEQFEAYISDAADEYVGWDHFYADHPDAEGYMRLANPVILEESGIALVHIDYFCFAYCGEGIFVLFRREGDQWVYSDLYSDWAG